MDFVRDRLNSALWLLRALSQRRDTILRVAESIVRRQKAFFDNGIMSLQPMTLKDVAATSASQEHREPRDVGQARPDSQGHVRAEVLLQFGPEGR